MNTMAMEAPSRRRRRKHSEEFKNSVVRACQQPGVSMAAVALANGLNATMLRRWVVLAEQGAGEARSSSTAMARVEPRHAFVEVALPPAAAPDGPSEIRIEVQRGALRVAVSWPTGQAAQCAAWLRELLR
jgi:transposase